MYCETPLWQGEGYSQLIAPRAVNVARNADADATGRSLGLGEGELLVVGRPVLEVDEEADES